MRVEKRLGPRNQAVTGALPGFRLTVGVARCDEQTAAACARTHVSPWRIGVAVGTRGLRRGQEREGLLLAVEEVDSERCIEWPFPRPTSRR
jgi:hypothetical protein